MAAKTRRAKKNKSNLHTIGNEDSSFDLIWKAQPGLIKNFIELRPRYEQLCLEVAYILEKRISSKQIEIAAVVHRAKSLSSFLEKWQRKTYAQPFEEIEDFAGVRVVCLYTTDLARIEKIIQKEFDVVDKVDKFNEKKPDQFGYGAIHYIVRLGKDSVGARYDDLTDLKCEIQVRTVLQDSWSIIDHHLVYKRESDVPSQIQRQLNGLAGLLETADNQFNQIRKERNQYIRSFARYLVNDPELLNAELNLDSLKSYLKIKFKKIKLAGWDGQISYLLDRIPRAKYKTLRDIDQTIHPYMNNISKTMKALKLPQDTAAVRLAVLLTLADAKIKVFITQSVIKRIKKVKKKNSATQI